MRRAVAFAVPGHLDTPTGGYAYDRRMVEALRAQGWSVEVIDLGEDFPNPSADGLARAGAMLAALDRQQPIVVDGLAFGAMPEAAAQLGTSRKLVALVHHPLAFESGLSPQDAARLRESERAALAHVRHVIVTSPATKRLVAGEYGVAADDITVVLPGSERLAREPRPQVQTVSLLAVGSLVPRKGYDILIAALATLQALPWQLRIAGDPTRDPATAQKLKADIAAHGLTDRIALLGAVPVERLRQLYAEADAFVLASRFEGYGMAYAEAIAAGLPVIATRSGAIPDTVPTDASLLVAPDDAGALADALRRLIADAPLRARLSQAARAAALRLPTWEEAGTLFSKTLERYL